MLLETDAPHLPLWLVKELAASQTPGAAPAEAGGITPPTLVAEYESVWNNTTTPKTASVTVSTGDRLVIFALIETNGTVDTPTGGGLTYTPLQSIQVANFCAVFAWTATAASGQTFTLSLSSASGNWWGFNALRYSGSDGIGASNKTNVDGAAPTLALTTSHDNSAVAAFVGDWNAVDGASRTWATINAVTPTAGNGGEVTYFRDGAHYTVYGAQWSNVGTAGSKAPGITAPGGQKYSIVAVEVRGSTGGGGGTTHDAEGTTTATATITGTAAVDRPISGTLAVTATATGTAARDVPVTGDRTATATATGSAGFTVAADGTTTATATRTGTAAVDRAANGTQTVTAARTGTVAVERMAQGSATATAARTGTATVEAMAAGNRATTATITGDATIIGRVDVDGTTTATATRTGTAQTIAQSSGVRSVAVTITGAANVVPPVLADGALTVSASRSGAATVAANGAGVLTASATISGDATVTAPYVPARVPVESGTTTATPIGSTGGATPTEASGYAATVE